MLSDSRFNTLRAYIALAWIDGNPTVEEQKWIVEKLENFHLSPIQRKTLLDELGTGLRLDDALKKITEQADLTLLVDQARVLFSSDGHYSDTEREFYKIIKEAALRNLDIDKVYGKSLMSRVDQKAKQDKKAANRHFIRALSNNISVFDFD